MEHWEALCPEGYQFVYDDILFRPSTDTFLLSAYPKLKTGMKICDLGSGTGLLGLLLLQRRAPKKSPDIFITGVEIQENAVNLAKQMISVNHLENYLIFQQGDLRDIQNLFPAGQFDLVLCNPPYYSPGNGKLAANKSRQIARSETASTLQDVCQAAAWLLRWGGKFCLCHKPERLADLICTLREVNLEPKRIRLVCKNIESVPSLILLEACRGGKPGLSIEAPLIMQQTNGQFTPEFDAIYFRI